jgi:hypothetical protein
MNAFNNKDSSEYKIYDQTDPEQNNLIGKLRTVAIGTQLRDCFGTGFVVVNGKEENRKYKGGLGACSNDAVRCGPPFV